MFLLQKPMTMTLLVGQSCYPSQLSWEECLSQTTEIFKYRRFAIKSVGYCQSRVVWSEHEIILCVCTLDSHMVAVFERAVGPLGGGGATLEGAHQERALLQRNPTILRTWSASWVLLELSSQTSAPVIRPSRSVATCALPWRAASL